MVALIVLEAVAIVLLGVLVAGLLRSHADILRTLHAMGAGVEPSANGSASPAVAHGAAGGTAAFDVEGVTPAGEAAAIGLVGARRRTLIAFLSTTCAGCAGLWHSLRDPAELAADGMSVVVVTKGPNEESVDELRRLAPASVPVPVLMSTQAWRDYGVTGAPYFVLVDGPTGRVVGEGVAARWGQVRALLGQARTDAERETRADEELLAAGIRPGDPRLHPQPGTHAGT